MRMFAKAILVLLAAALLLPMLPLSMGQVETRPVETVAENLFNKGIGHPWVGGDPFASSNQMQSAASLDQKQCAECVDPNYQIIGYLNVTSGVIVASDSGNSLRFTPGPGSYPVYGYFKENKMTGIFIDFKSPLL